VVTLRSTLAKLSLFVGDRVKVDDRLEVFYRYPDGSEPSRDDLARAVAEFDSPNAPATDGVHRAHPSSEAREDLIRRGLLRPRA
jgi:hypothetical protein